MELFHLILTLCCVVVKCNKDVTSDEKVKKDQERSDKITVNRRFQEDQNDDEWHISHLKETDVLDNSYCQGDTVEDKIRKYKKTLLNDGALIDFVSAKMLPQNESELISNSCRKLNDTHSMNITLAKHTDENSENVTHIASTTIATSNSDGIQTQTDAHYETKPTDADAIVSSSNVTENLAVLTTPNRDTATTVKLKKAARKIKKESNAGDKRRASEYMFSSVEYYDEVVDFEKSKCPEAVDIIALEIDQLRNYDVECEMMMEWKSLD